MASRTFLKSNCEAAIDIELIEYDDSLRTAYEQRQQRLFASRAASEAQQAREAEEEADVGGEGRQAAWAARKLEEDVVMEPQLSRQLQVTGSVCVSRMEIGQRSINFGEVENWTAVEKTIILHNRAAVPLLYKVAKTGRHASFDVQIRHEDRRGCVRPYGSRQVRFVFRPSLSGPYREVLTIHNVQDREDVQEVTLKAMVKRAEPFLLKAPPLDFGPSLLGKACHEVKRLVLVNVARGARTFTVECQPTVRLTSTESPAEWWRAEMNLRLEGTTADGAGEVLAQERAKEEQLETLERKLRIAIRKKKPEKAEKLKRKIANIKSGEAGSISESDAGVSDSDMSDWYNSESESEEPRALQSASSGSVAVRRGVDRDRHANGSRPPSNEKLTFRLGRGGTQTVAVTLTICKIDGVPTPAGAANVAGLLRVADTRDNDSAQLLAFSTCVCSDLDELKAAHVAIGQGGINALTELPELRHQNPADPNNRPVSPPVGPNRKARDESKAQHAAAETIVDDEDAVLAAEAQSSTEAGEMPPPPPKPPKPTQLSSVAATAVSPQRSRVVVVVEVRRADACPRRRPKAQTAFHRYSTRDDNQG